MGLLWSIMAGLCVALLFSLAIFIHELGHFLAARLLGLHVDAFAIGFGPALWKRTIDGIAYKVGCIPFGGYVALPQLDPSGMEKVQGEAHGERDPIRDLPEIPPWKRIVVSLAGPFGNLVLAVVLAYVIFWTPGVRTGVIAPVIGEVVQNSQAWVSGLRPRDRILKLNGKPVQNWNDLQVEFQLVGEAGSAAFLIQRGEETLTLDLPFQTNNIVELRMLEGVFPEAPCVVATIQPGSPAANAGLRGGDRVLAVNHTPVEGAYHFSEQIRNSRGAPVTLQLQRGKTHLQKVVTPRYDAQAGRYLIGMSWQNPAEQVKPWMMYRNPWQQIRWDALSVARVLQALIAPAAKGERRAVAKNVGGPVAIVIGLYHTVRGSMVDALGFLRMICVNLAILNLLPFPVLDGGHILFALYEIITRRKPHPKVVAVLVNAFAVLLIGLMLLLFYRDIVRQVRTSRNIHALEREEAEQSGNTNTNATIQP